MNAQILLEGRISVEADLRAGLRRIERIYVRQDELDKKSGIHRLAERNDIPIEVVGADRIEEMVSGRTHGGVLSLVG